MTSIAGGTSGSTPPVVGVLVSDCGIAIPAMVATNPATQVRPLVLGMAACPVLRCWYWVVEFGGRSGLRRVEIVCLRSSSDLFVSSRWSRYTRALAVRRSSEHPRSLLALAVCVLLEAQQAPHMHDIADRLAGSTEGYGATTPLKCFFLHGHEP